MHIHRQFPINSQGRDFFIGDLHGRYPTLMKKLEFINFDEKKDRIFWVGDLIDRGNCNAECLGLLNKPWFYAVRGNHEDMVIRRMRGSEVDQYFAEKQHEQNGGRWFGRLKLHAKTRILSIIDEMPIAITIETVGGAIGIIHAGWHKSWVALQNADALSEDDLDIALWARHEDAAFENTVEDVMAIVSGHQNDKQPIKSGNQLWIDTLWQSNELTCLSSAELFQWLKMPDGVLVRSN